MALIPAVPSSMWGVDEARRVCRNPPDVLTGTHYRLRADGQGNQETLLRGDIHGGVFADGVGGESIDRLEFLIRERRLQGLYLRHFSSTFSMQEL